MHDEPQNPLLFPDDEPTAVVSPKSTPPAGPTSSKRRRPTKTRGHVTTQAAPPPSSEEPLLGAGHDGEEVLPRRGGAMPQSEEDPQAALAGPAGGVYIAAAEAGDDDQASAPNRAPTEEEEVDARAEDEAVVEQSAIEDADALLQAAEPDSSDEEATGHHSGVRDGLLLRESLSLAAQVEALLFASPRPLKALELWEFLQREDLSIKAVVDIAEGLKESYALRGGGFRLEHLPGKGYQFQTVAAASILMERMFSERPRPLSRAAQETLAIIAYRQPVTRADIEFIRGVDAGSIIKNLLERELIHCVGRREDAGRPMLFATTDEFLKVYRLTSLGELPPLEAFQPASDTVKSALDKIGAERQVDVEAMIVGSTARPDAHADDDDELYLAEPPGPLPPPQQDVAAGVRQEPHGED